uniref:Yippee domain-containing protein n=1 Tax=Hyaloperonospora arabidopsidis (strain Emoy2) TaxID=559515 RepID=M4C1Z5_HYAAE
MPPLVVIRSGCQHVEYLENRIPWRRTSQNDCSSENDDKATDDDKMGREVEETWDRISGDFCGGVSKAFGFSRERCDVEDMHAFRCAECGNMVADHNDIIAKTFFGRTGKAFLMDNMYNVHIGSSRKCYLRTGFHSIADVLCGQCDFVLGWKYIKAMESSQKYKEGKYIMEHAVVQDDAEELDWDRL